VLLVSVPGELLIVKLRSLTDWPMLMIVAGARRLVIVTWI
jgi:hypothetical protein